MNQYIERLSALGRCAVAGLLAAVLVAGCGGGGGGEGSSPAVAPSITAQPASASVVAGATATFSVTASGTAPLSYQWRRGGTNISGATSASYTTPATSSANNGELFSVVVTNSAGSKTSSNATLTVTTAAVAPSITTQPANATVTAGQTATFSVTASGTTPLSYQWRRGGTNISGATSASYTLQNTTSSDNGAQFSVVVTNSAGSVTSSNATLTVTTGTSLFPATIQLSSLNGTNGFRIPGAAANDQAGYSVSHAGDVNGDGIGDFIVGALAADVNDTNSGAAYVVFGKQGGFGANLNLSTLNGTTGFRISGEAWVNYAGCSVSAAGDVNGDGYDDLLVGAYGVSTSTSPGGGFINPGAAYVVFGKASGYTANLNLSTLNGANGFQLNGIVKDDNTGWSVSSAGDINGDGFDDVIVGAWGADPNGTNSGAAYVVFGKAGGFAATFS
ncbi:MAG: immunoglobulin domain-containing protein, partial [Betaproteobacteria bacterium]